MRKNESSEAIAAQIASTTATADELAAEIAQDAALAATIAAQEGSLAQQETGDGASNLAALISQLQEQQTVREPQHHRNKQPKGASLTPPASQTAAGYSLQPTTVAQPEASIPSTVLYHTLCTIAVKCQMI
eukprot:m.127862 g.127862  ORF g.127862 m.127862 type:complete len:131 (+) comp15809_c0_seq4:746-1138(+)